MDLAKNHACIR